MNNSRFTTWKVTVISAIAVILAACTARTDPSSDPCARAYQRLQAECPNVSAHVDGSVDNLSCTGQAACAADCLYESPCVDIQKNNGAYKSCVDACK
jgi:hypothetical protein